MKEKWTQENKEKKKGEEEKKEGGEEKKKEVKDERRWACQWSRVNLETCTNIFLHFHGVGIREVGVIAQTMM